MSKRFPSDDWARALGDALAASDAYRTAADGWAPGLLALVIAGQPDAEAAVIDLIADGASAGRALPAADAEAGAAFVLSATADVWDGLLSGERDAVKALMGGDVKVRKGDLATLVGQVFAYAELMKVAATLD